MNLFLENIRLALFSLKANKMRALLTMLGIIIGISSVIAIMTVGNSLSSYMTGELSSMGTNNVYVYLSPRETEKESTEEGYVFEGDETDVSPTDEDYISREMVENYLDTYKDSIAAIGITKSLGEGKLLDGTNSANVSVSGVTLGSLVSDNVEMIDGRFFSSQEVDNAKRVCIISDRAAEKMFGEDDNYIGKNVQVNVRDKFYDFTIVGVYKYEQSAGSFLMVSYSNVSTNLYIPYTAAEELLHSKLIGGITVMVESGVNPDEFADTTKQFFATYYRNNKNFVVEAYSMASYVKMMTSMMGTLTTAIAVIAGIALLVGGIGVMNIMLVSITERTREIGTRKALGAPNSSIRLQFIVEAVVICLIGGVIGVLIGVGGGCLAAKLLLKAPASPSALSIVLSLGFSMLIGVFFGYYPANKAAKMDPIEALRYE